MLEKNVKHDSWPIQPDILNPPCYDWHPIIKKPPWLDLQPIVIRSRWSHNWKSAQVVNSHLVCDPTIRQREFDLGNSGLCLTVFARNRDTVVPGEKNGDLQTLICVLVTRTRRCPTLSNPVPRQNEWRLISATLWMKTLFCGWPVMVHDTHTRRILPVLWKLAGDRMRMLTNLLKFQILQWWWKWNVVWNLYPGPDHHQKLTSSSDW